MEDTIDIELITNSKSSIIDIHNSAIHKRGSFIFKKIPQTKYTFECYFKLYNTIETINRLIDLGFEAIK